MATKRTDEKIKIGADTTAADSGLKRLSGLAKAAIAAVVAVAVGAVARMGAALVGMFRVQEQADARLRRSLVATGRYSAEEEKRLNALADHIQSVSTTGDEVAQKVIGSLIQVGRVQASQVEAATFATIGLARFSGRSLERIQRTVAKSLSDIADDSKKELGELEQYFTSSEREKLRALKETEGGAAAQAEAIRLLDSQYRQHAQAIEGSTDVYEQLGNTWGDVKEELGGMVHQLVGPLAEWINEALPRWIAGMQDVYISTASIGYSLDVNYQKLKKFFGLASEADVEGAITRMIEAQDRIRASLSKTGGGAKTTGGPSGAPGGAPDQAKENEADKRAEERERARILQERQASDDRQALLRATLQGRTDAEVEYRRASIEAERLHNEGLKLLGEERTRALGENLISEAALKQEHALVEREQAEAAHQEALNAELAQAYERNEALLEEERRAGDEKKRIQAATDLELTKKQRAFFDLAASAQLTGNKKLDTLIKTAARARLLVALATKPFEAFAQTSAAYPFPLGPILGAAHAVLVASQIGIGLAAVGGGGSSRGSPAVANAPDVAKPQEEQRPLVLHATIEADGESIARVVQRRLDYADND